MKKRVLTLLMSMVFVFFAFAANTFAFTSNLVISQTNSPVYINGSIVPFEAYNINGNNYFKLRDIAYYLNGTESQFGVDWSESTNSINLSTGTPYTPVGGEGELRFGSYTFYVYDANPSVTVNYDPVYMQAYNIQGNNYFKLRDLGNAVGFGVDWSEELQSVIIYTNPQYQYVQQSAAYDEYVNEVLRLTNIERVNNGLSELTLDSSICAAADIRADEINTLFEHTRPDGTQCFTALKDAGVSYRTAAENIAIGQRTPEEVVTGWMNSPGHRANILNGNLHKIGIGVAHATQSPYSSGYAWVQLFTN